MLGEAQVKLIIMKNYGEMCKEKYQNSRSNKYLKEGGIGVIDRKHGTAENRSLPGLLFQGQCLYTPVALSYHFKQKEY